MDTVLLEKELPIKMVAYGRCFRTEAGAAGAAGKGLYRVHQFTKVGLVVGLREAHVSSGRVTRLLDTVSLA
jgi:seryl-tRNA synthetase